MIGAVSHLARHVLRTSAHKLLILGQEVFRQPLRTVMLPLRLRPELRRCRWATGREACSLHNGQPPRSHRERPHMITQPQEEFQYWALPPVYISFWTGAWHEEGPQRADLGDPGLLADVLHLDAALGVALQHAAYQVLHVWQRRRPAAKQSSHQPALAHLMHTCRALQAATRSPAAFKQRELWQPLAEHRPASKVQTCSG